MKLAFMTFSTPDLSLAETLAVAARLGYDGIEPRVGCGHAHGLEYAATAAARRDARAMAADSGIAFACVATSCVFSDPATRDGNLADGLRAVELAGDLGAPTVRVFGGAIGAGTTRAGATELAAGALAELGRAAAGRGVTVCMETHDAWCDPLHVAAVMRLADHPAVGVNWDVMHPVRAGLATVEESYTILAPWIRHCHVHDGASGEALAFAPLGTGVIDHASAIGLLARDGFAGYLSGEWIGWEPWETHLPREGAWLRASLAGATGGTSGCGA